QLFLAKKDGGAGAWLTEKDVKEGVSDRDTSDLELLDVAGAPLNVVGLSEEDVRFQVTKEVVKAGKVPVHVLVVVPTGIDITIGGDGNADSVLELKHYQKRGVQIQSNCKEYCERILDKIDSLYQLDGVLPFICVEGSSGMGKSQLAFALGGRRRWFYWPATSVGVDSQRLYSNFTSIADRFDEVTRKDKVLEKYKVNILNCASTVYSHDKLWIYGFILALLKYYDKLEDDRDAGMIRFEKNVSLHVDMCDRDTVAAFLKKLKDEDKAVPFFMLDELTANTHHDDQGEKFAAFQRNVFRACGLVLVVMGTDAKIANLIHQAGGSSGDQHFWMTVISRFPPYQPISFVDEAKQAAWERIQNQYPVLNDIVVNSRGRFARYFVDRAAEYALKTPVTVDLCDLLDDAFCHVLVKVQESKRFMSKQGGRNAQMMAMSYTNADPCETSPPQAKRRKIDVGIKSMHLHFANLVDSQHTDVNVSQGVLVVNNKQWLPLCRFPTTAEDVLLYLAVLGGKTYSGYYDVLSDKHYSVWNMFSLWKRGPGYNMGENTQAVSNDFKYYENMVAHMIFCASRRNGVRGILFEDFFPWLLGEFQEQVTHPTKLMMDEEEMAFSGLLDGYNELAQLPGKNVPFLAPPNAEWPPYILGADWGCFGHLDRLKNEERSDISVREVSSDTPLFFCECKYWHKKVDSRAMKGIIKGLETVQEDKWKIVFVFCVGLTNFRKGSWAHGSIGCVRIDCRSGDVKWVVQPDEGHRKKLVVVMETGPVQIETHMSGRNSAA
ncbi:hypothetical protein PI125_g23688, partial [Phytophthora idaei]